MWFPVAFILPYIYYNPLFEQNLSLKKNFGYMHKNNYLSEVNLVKLPKVSLRSYNEGAGVREGCDGYAEGFKRGANVCREKDIEGEGAT